MKKLLFLFFLLVVLTPGFAYAEDTASATDVTSTPVPNGTLQKREEFMQAKQEYMQKKQDAIKAMQEKRGERHDLMTNLQPTIQAQRELMKQKFQAAKDEFKQKLSQIKDEKKKTIAEKVDTNLAAINKRRTDQMTTNINKLVTILNKIKTKRDTAQAAGKDVTALNAAITSAESAIATAQAAVTTQAGKNYTAQVTDPTTLRTAMETVRKQLASDLLTTHKTVHDAKTAVLNAAKALMTLSGGTMDTLTPTVAVTEVPTAEPTQ